MPATSGLQRSFGALLVVMVLLQAVLEWHGGQAAGTPMIVAVLLLAGLMARLASGVGRIFLSVAAVASLVTILINPDWQEDIRRALLNAGFFAAFFSALTVLRNAAGRSKAMRRAGTYLALQPPGRRYLALTAGTHAFALFLNYGAIQLMGALALSSASADRDSGIRMIRVRRMLLAIHRGFVSSLAWSPLGFAIVISISMIPGTSYGGIALPGLVTATIIMASGWALDMAFKPAMKGPRPVPRRSAYGPRTLLPLGTLLLIMVIPVVALERLTETRVVGIVLLLVPLLSLAWIGLQSPDIAGMRGRLGAFVAQDLPDYRTEVTLIASAGYLGAVGATIAEPVLAGAGIELGAVPPVALLLGLVWIMPLLGQVGANPILSMSLVAPLLPPAAELGLSPNAFAVALIAGWTMTGITSPFTATTLLIGRFGGIRAIEVGWVWNRAYFLGTTGLLCIWVLIHAAMASPSVAL